MLVIDLQFRQKMIFRGDLNDPSNLNYKDGVNSCCGTGPYGGIFTCGGTKEVKDYQLCVKILMIMYGGILFIPLRGSMRTLQDSLEWAPFLCRAIQPRRALLS
ncbi:hypothetical protein Prudu_020282 [Prunus dulcis]|uniref:Uncharacterized protein n=1 Tax=Prunus dulcis TaxID=3755 RepID=A0A4Y1RW30_PRUDU|nr:hypothetical protein Prudu_020282 [Prunus dulcis]